VDVQTVEEEEAPWSRPPQGRKLSEQSDPGVHWSG